MGERRGALAVVTAAAIITLTACAATAADDDPSILQPSPTDASDDGPTLAGYPLFEGSPLPEIPLTEVVPEDPLGVVDVTRATASGDVLVVAGSDASGYAQVDALDLSTGEELWRRETSFDPIEAPDDTIVSLFSQDGWLVDGADLGPLQLELYLANPCDEPEDWCRVADPDGTREVGVVALDGRTGDDALWAEPVIESVAGDDEEADRVADAAVRIVAVSSQAIIVNVDGGPAGFDRDEEGDLMRTVALDPRTGRSLWTADGVHADRIAGATVLGYRPPPEPLGLADDAGVLVGLEIATGEERWGLDDEGPAIWLGRDADSSLGAARFLDAGYAVVEGGDGSVVTGLERQPVLTGDVATWSEDVAALGAAEADLVSVTPGESAVRAPDPASPETTYVSGGGGYLWAEHADGTFVATDRGGTPLSAELHGSALRTANGAIVAVSDGTVRIWRTTEDPAPSS
ncbi:hypothetical protein [Microbacterium indicum]|uniref:hypothetical protein n=1 Tax=Microbacterium indicum TaxID=358100 RepID=UPI0004258120|nr:hypothetical protein [Microbacterium indicum]